MTRFDDLSHNSEVSRGGVTTWTTSGPVWRSISAVESNERAMPLARNEFGARAIDVGDTNDPAPAAWEKRIW